MGLKGYTVPRTPEGRSSLVPYPPWHYVGAFLVIDYWADPEKAVGPDAPGQSVEAGLARRGHRGMVSAEWAVGIVAAVAIAGVLLAVVTSGEVQDSLLKFLLWVIKGFISVVD